MFHMICLFPPNTLTPMAFLFMTNSISKCLQCFGVFLFNHPLCAVLHKAKKGGTSSGKCNQEVGVDVGVESPRQAIIVQGALWKTLR